MKTIQDLGLSARAYNTLLNANVSTIDQLITMNRKELLRIPNCGMVTFREIEDVVSSLQDNVFSVEAAVLLELADAIEEQAQILRQKARKLQAIDQRREP